MPRVKKNGSLPPSTQPAVRYHETDDGQITFFPVAMDKVRGPVFDSLIETEFTNPLFVDDTYDGSKEALPIQTKIMLDYGSIVEQGSELFDAFDREVLDAVATLYQDNSVFSMKAIYLIMVGKTKFSSKVRGTQLINIRRSIEKCSRIRVRIDVTDLVEKDSPIGKELKKKGLKSVYSGYLIPCDTLDITTYIDYDCYIRLLSEPPIFTYAKAFNKISTFPLCLFDTQINKTPRLIVLQSFLLRSIDAMYRGERKCKISSASIYKAINCEAATTQHKARFRSMTERVLSSWVERGFIRNYRKLKPNDSNVAGYDIELRKELLQDQSDRKYMVLLEGESNP